jgi:glucose-6-phosphate isomerase
MPKNISAALGNYQPLVDSALNQLREQQIIKRIWQRDYTVWKPQPSEIANRLGWLDIMERMQGNLAELNKLVDAVRSAGYSDALLLGMGGSSLAPEVLRMTFGVKTGYLDLAVLDSTDPAAVLAHSERLDPEKTLFIVSTKSGGTVETFSFFKFYYNWMANAVGEAQAGEHFIAITDPGSGLADTARQYHFRATFFNDPTIGGRYSALSFFGLAPAALAGIDIVKLLHSASEAAENNRALGVEDDASWLGAILGSLANVGRDKVTIVTSPALTHFGVWAEQLIAESTGKEGVGILPVDGEALLSPKYYAADRLFIYVRLVGDGAYDTSIEAISKAGHPVVQIDLSHLSDLGAEFFRWEMATAIAGYFLGINPFDQPNVESAKVAARTMMAAYQKEGELPSLTSSLSEGQMTVYADKSVGKQSIGEMLHHFLAQADAGDESEAGRSYVSLQAYLTPNPDTDSALQELRTQIQRRTRLATTVGYGPRFLHSTGQLHKGDGGHGLFIQFTAHNLVDVAIPDQAGQPVSSITFGVLKTAQALGDRQALLDAGRRVVRIDLGADVLGGLEALAEAI